MSQTLDAPWGGWFLSHCVNIWCRTWLRDWSVYMGQIPNTGTTGTQTGQHFDWILPCFLPHVLESLSSICKWGRR